MFKRLTRSEEHVLAFRVTRHGWSLLIDDGFDGEWITKQHIGRNVFLTLEEAEKVLAEKEGAKL